MTLLSKAIANTAPEGSTYRGNTLKSTKDSFDNLSWTGDAPQWSDVEQEMERIIFKSTVPDSINSFNAKRALLQSALLDQIETLVSSADKETQLAWDSPVWNRTDEHVINLGAAIGLTERQIDELFIQAGG